MLIKFRCFCNLVQIICVFICVFCCFIAPAMSANSITQYTIDGVSYDAPSGYKFLQSVNFNSVVQDCNWTTQTTGTYIVKAKFKYNTLSTTKYNALFGADNGMYFGASTNGNFSPHNLTSNSINFTISTNTWYEMSDTYNRDTGGITGTLNNTSYTSTRSGVNSSPWYLGSFSTNTLYPVADAELNYVVVNYNNSNIHIYIPMQRTNDNAVGYYDFIDKVFITNSAWTANALPEIKIATTKYVEDKFAPSVSELNTAIGTVKTVVDNTIIQADRIGKLYTGKQTRPSDTCPDGAQCLLITEADGTLHWYPICNADGTVGTGGSSSSFDVSAFLAQLAEVGDGYYYVGNTTQYNALGGTGSVRTSQPSTDSIVRQLEETEWAVLWNNNGVIYGTSACNSNSGTLGVGSIEEQSDTGGLSCWCKITNIVDTNRIEHNVSDDSSWIFYSSTDYPLRVSENCSYYCAYYCGMTMNYYPNFREGIGFSE